MGISWTTEQQKVIDLRNRNILVSAAAGSGKTAVLVERIITRLTKDEHPLNIDELLSVTFANAAAAEMKERIRDAIEVALETDPDNEHLQRQVTLIHNAKITTIHSFCLDVIREYFHVIDLDPTFRIAEDGELSLLKQDVIEKLLEEEYGNAEAGDKFLGFVEVLAPGKKDVFIEELILSLYASSRSNPCPEEWLQQCASNYQIDSVADMEGSVYAKGILEEIHSIIDDCRVSIRSAIDICNAPCGPTPYKVSLQSDLDLFDRLEKAEGLSALESIFSEKTVWATLKGVSKKDKENGTIDEALIERVKEKRDLAKGPINDFKKAYFGQSLEEHVEVLKRCKPIVEELVRLIMCFDARYMAEKRKKNMIEFNDMEHYALQILTTREDGEFHPSDVAKEYQKKFQEVMIDEYQDSNLIQEIIVTSVSRVSQGIYNVFMVGDVKQSIYSFRSSRPELFMEKFNTYTTGNPGPEELVEKQRIDLDRNFRSRKEVLDGTNYIFEKIMRARLGGVEYDKAAALYLGADFKPQVGNEMEVRILDESKAVREDNVIVKIEETKAELEARDVAMRIKELVGHHQILDKQTKDFRETKFSDIVILTRSTTDWPTITEVFGQAGIPVHMESKEGYFTAWEIALLLDYLRVIDNPKQDIPLTAILSSSVFGNVSDMELAMIRSQYPRWKFHEAVYAYANLDGEDWKGKVVDKALQGKLRCCLQQIQDYRECVSYMAIHELLWHILEETGYQEIVYARPEGEQRLANLKMLLEKATVFEGTSYKGLFNFIRYIEQLQKYKVEMGEASISAGKGDIVRAMTIHKSKGLEFPIVFLMGMGKQFNLKDASGMVLKHSDLGIGMDAIDTELRVKESSIFRRAIANQIKLDSKGEELRILYVAMTRAKEKLIMTGAVKKLDEEIEGWTEEGEQRDSLSYLQLTQAHSYFDWILPCVYREEAPVQVVTYTAEDCLYGMIEEVVEAVTEGIALEEVRAVGAYDRPYSELLEQQLNYQYAFEGEKEFKLKMTVSEIKKRAQLAEEAGEELIKPAFKQNVKQVPEFMKDAQEVKAKKQGAFRGTAYHRIMEIWDFASACSLEQVAQCMLDFVEDGRLEEEMYQCIDAVDVLEFLNSDLGQRMQKAAKEKLLYKEQPFVMKVPARDVYQIETDEITIVQGIIDVYFVESDGIVLLDYKTDRVQRIEELDERYHAQLEYYAKAIEQLTGLKVKERIAYSFTLKQYHAHRE